MESPPDPPPPDAARIPDPGGVAPLPGGVLEVARGVRAQETCPYLKDRPARTEIRLAAAIEGRAWSDLLAAGYRRFGMILFRPVCEGCSECIPIRIPVGRFLPSRGQRRVLRRNRDVVLELGEPLVDEERLALHRAFHLERSERAGWDREDIDAEGYSRIFLENIVATLEFRYRIGGRLAAVAYVDDSPDALNSIYCFWDPAHRARSLGTLDVLREIEVARTLGRRWLYLGFHVAGCRSMAYKAGFRPAEVRAGGEWKELEGA